MSRVHHGQEGIRILNGDRGDLPRRLPHLHLHEGARDRQQRTRGDHARHRDRLAELDDLLGEKPLHHAGTRCSRLQQLRRPEARRSRRLVRGEAVRSVLAQRGRPIESRQSRHGRRLQTRLRRTTVPRLLCQFVGQLRKSYPARSRLTLTFYVKPVFFILLHK